MAAAKVIGKILGMFDKVDDIVYEPIKLLCDALRQPLKQIDERNKKIKAEHDQELIKQLKQFEANLELDKKKREMELTVDQRRMEEEINQMILDNDLHRREDMVQLEMKYRKDMAEAAAQRGHRPGTAAGKGSQAADPATAWRVAQERAGRPSVRAAGLPQPPRGPVRLARQFAADPKGCARENAIMPTAPDADAWGR